MKILAAIPLCILMTFGCSCNNNAKKSETVKTVTCFTEANFDSVYKYIENQIKNGNQYFYKYEDYQIFLKGSIEIQNVGTLSKITKENGVISIQTKQKVHNKILEKTNQIFCEILSKTEKGTSTFCINEWNMMPIDSFSQSHQYPDQYVREQIKNKSNNSCIQDKLVENYYLSGIDTNLVKRNGDTLRLTLNNGKYLYLINKNDDFGDGAIGYTLNYIFKEEGFYFVNVQPYEGHYFLLINIKTGEKTSLFGYPSFSPNKEIIIAVSDGSVCGPEYFFSGVQVINNKNGKLKAIKICENWYAGYVEWIDNTSFKIAKTLADPNCNIYYKFYKVKIK